MAAINFDDYGDHEHRGTLAAVLNWGGAFLSVVLIAGLATWGWKLWVRDVTGIPVVRALEGPMRVAPDEPGGLASEYQGLTVNRIAEERTEVAPSDQVVLAPAPATLNEDEDLAMADLRAVPAIGEPETLEEADAALAAALESAERASDPAIETVAVEPSPALSGSLTMRDEDPIDSAAMSLIDEDEDAAGIVTSEAEPSATDIAVAAALADIGLKPEPAVAKIADAAQVPFVTPRPMMRPANLQRVSLEAPVVTDGEVDASTIAAGTRLVQLGAYASPEIADIEWANMEARFGDYMVGKERVIQPAKTGGRSFFRLRAMGFENLADARRFCAVLVADGANCIPVVHD